MTVLHAEQTIRMDVEAGGWLRLQQCRPDLDGMPPTELLTLSEQLGGNLRHALRPSGVVLHGEIRWPDVDFSLAETRTRLLGFLEPSLCIESFDPELLESVLASSGLSWSRRDAVWVVPPAHGCPQELRIAADPQAVRVEAVLASWSSISDTVREAVATFLCRSHVGLRFARAEMDTTSARVVSRVEEVEFLDAELLDSLHSVAAACRLLTREVEALLYEDLAQAYLQMSGVGSTSHAPAAVSR